MSDVFDLVLHHDQTVDTATECKAGVFVAIDSRCLQYIRMDHSAAEKFDPLAARTDRTTVFTKRTAEGEFETWLSEWEIKRVNAHVKLASVIFLEERLQGCD